MGSSTSRLPVKPRGQADIWIFFCSYCCHLTQIQTTDANWDCFSQIEWKVKLKSSQTAKPSGSWLKWRMAPNEMLQLPAGTINTSTVAGSHQTARYGIDLVSVGATWRKCKRGPQSATSLNHRWCTGIKCHQVHLCKDVGEGWWYVWPSITQPGDGCF